MLVNGSEQMMRKMTEMEHEKWWKRAMDEALIGFIYYIKHLIVS